MHVGPGIDVGGQGHRFALEPVVEPLEREPCPNDAVFVFFDSVLLVGKVDVDRRHAFLLQGQDDDFRSLVNKNAPVFIGVSALVVIAAVVFVLFQAGVFSSSQTKELSLDFSGTGLEVVSAEASGQSLVVTVKAAQWKSLSQPEKEKAFRDFHALAAQNEHGDRRRVFDDLPTGLELNDPDDFAVVDDLFGQRLFGHARPVGGAGGSVTLLL